MSELPALCWKRDNMNLASRLHSEDLVYREASGYNGGMDDLNDFYGPNAGYVLDLYDRYQHDPASVDDRTRALFQEWTPPEEDERPSGQPSAPTAVSGEP